MTPRHLTQIWSVLGIVNLYWALNTFLIQRGAAPAFTVDFVGLIDTRPIPAAVIGLHVCAVLSVIAWEVGSAHARSQRARTWDARLPVFWLEGVTPGRPGPRLYQTVFLLAFVLFPAAALVHFADRADRTVVIARDATTGTLHEAPLFTAARAPAALCPGPCREIRIAPKDVASAEKRHAAGISWSPRGSLAVLALLLGAAAIALLRLLVSLFRPR